MKTTSYFMWILMPFLTINLTSGNNIIKNPSAEKGKQSWGYYRAAGLFKWGVTSSNPHSGEKCLYFKTEKFYKNGSAAGALVAGDWNGYYPGPNSYNVKPATWYDFSFWVKRDGQGQEKVFPSVMLFDDKAMKKKYMCSVSLKEIIPTSGWTKYQGRFKTMSKTHMMAFMFVVRCKEINGDKPWIFYIDDLKVNEAGAKKATALKGIVIPRLSKPPTVDGQLDDMVWKQAAVFRLKTMRGGKLKNPTNVYVAYDKNNLYMAFKCSEKNMRKLVNRYTHAEEHDNSLWTDDCVEIFMQPEADGSGNKLYHIIVNSAGITYDAFNGNTSWESDAKVAVSKGANGWNVEIAIPFRALGYHPQGGEFWQLNLAREEKPSRELSCLRGEGLFTDLSRQKKIMFAANGNNPVRIESIRLYGQDMVKIYIDNPSPTIKRYKTILTVKNAQQAETFSEVKNVDIPEHDGKSIIMFYRKDSKSNELMVRVEDQKSNKVVYENSYKFPANSIVNNALVWQIKKPLFAELFSKRPVGLAKDGAFYWNFESLRSSCSWFALQYGLKYIYADAYRQLKDKKLLQFGVPGVVKKIQPYAQRYGFKCIYVPRPVNKKRLLWEPEVYKEYLDSIAKLGKYRSIIWGVSLGDEIFSHHVLFGMELLQRKDPYALKLDKEVKKIYGEGKYGIPCSKNDSNPFRWIAWRRYVCNKLGKLQQDVRNIVKEKYPELYFISDDPPAINNINSFASWNNLDVVTHQLYPMRRSNYPFFGYLAKRLVDLSGAKEIWPCTHVENYSGIFTPEETLELLSQAVRNGATGLDFYASDHLGYLNKKKYMRSISYGAPQCWQVITTIIDELSRMPRLKFPEPESALFYSIDSIRSIPGMIMDRKNPSAYTFLGPVAGTWFKFTSEDHLEKQLDKLSNYKVVFLPFAKYERRSAIDALHKYVTDGGTAVAFDPEIFSFSLTGKDISTSRTKLFGIESIVSKRHKTIKHGSLRLPVRGYAFDLKLTPGTQVWARFEDGMPAITVKKYGKGKAYYFAASPCVLGNLSDDNWKKFFKDFVKELGLKTDRKIWRFEFPKSLIKPLPEPKGKCLTNNYIMWRQYSPITKQNIDTGGTYSYSVTPDFIKDQGGIRNIPFSKGDLTDRRNAPNAPDAFFNRATLNDWIVGFKGGKTFDILFDFKKVYPVFKVKIYYRYTSPDVSIKLSKDGKTWETHDFPAKINSGEATLDIKERILSFPATDAQFIKLVFAENKKSKKIIIAEIEIW